MSYHGPTPEDLRLKVKEAYESGMSLRQIGLKLGITKGSAAGIVYKMSSLGQIKQRSNFRFGNPIYGETVKKPKKAYVPKPRIPRKKKPVRFADLPVSSKHSCLFIAVERKHFKDTDFCGAPSVEGRPYCAAHAERCYMKRGPDDNHD